MPFLVRCKLSYHTHRSKRHETGKTEELFCFQKTVKETKENYF